MNRVIAITQAVFVALGTMAMLVLGKVDTDGADALDLARTWLGQYGVWCLGIPVAWYLNAQYLAPKARLAQSLVHGSGIILAGLIFALYGFLILF